MTSGFRLALAIATGILVAGCAGTPPPPDWKMNAQSALESYERHYLNGNTRLAELNYERARSEIARTGRPDLMARAELIRCATEISSLATEHCAATATLPLEASADDKAYAAFLAGNWAGLDPSGLPEAYRTLIKAKDEAARVAALKDIKAPFSRLIAAGVLFRQTSLPPAGIAIAMETASEQGWRRPLLAWLNMQLQRAETAGEKEATAHLRQRIELVHGSLPASEK